MRRGFRSIPSKKTFCLGPICDWRRLKASRKSQKRRKTKLWILDWVLWLWFCCWWFGDRDSWFSIRIEVRFSSTAQSQRNRPGWFFRLPNSNRKPFIPKNPLKGKSKKRFWRKVRSFVYCFALLTHSHSLFGSPSLVSATFRTGTEPNSTKPRVPIARLLLFCTVRVLLCTLQWNLRVVGEFGRSSHPAVCLPVCPERFAVELYARCNEEEDSLLHCEQSGRFSGRSGREEWKEGSIGKAL